MKTIDCTNCKRAIWGLRLLNDTPMASSVASLSFCSKECANEWVDDQRESVDARADELRKESAMPDPSDLD